MVEDFWSLLGLSDADVAAYRRVLDQPSESVADHAVALGVPLAAWWSSAETLIDQGLVYHSGETVLAHPPTVALVDLVQRRRDDLAGAEIIAAQLDRVFQAGRVQLHSGGLFEVVRGGASILTQLKVLLETATTSLQLVDAPPYVGEGSPDLFDAETAARERGVRISSLVDHSALGVPRHLDDLLRSVREGQEVRLADVPTKMAIADRRIVLMPLAVDLVYGEPQAAVIAHPELVAALVRLFDLVFETSVPLSTDLMVEAATDSTSDATVDAAGGEGSHQDLVRLLHAGMNDAALARHLGVSERTLRRRIADLQQMYGARSRFQLGVAIARRES